MNQEQVTRLEEIKKRKEDRERAALFEAMLKTPAWEAYEKLLNFHIGQRMASLIEPTLPNGELAAEHNKGTVFALTFARDLPRVTVEAAKTSGPATDGEDDE